MKKIKNESELIKAAIAAGMRYCEARGVVKFETTDSAYEKTIFIYRQMVRDNLIHPLPEDQVSIKSVQHKLAVWYAKQLPAGHPLLK
jgi:hypothetical protein